MTSSATWFSPPTDPWMRVEMPRKRLDTTLMMMATTGVIASENRVRRHSSHSISPSRPMTVRPSLMIAVSAVEIDSAICSTW